MLTMRENAGQKNDCLLKEKEKGGQAIEGKED